MGQRSNGTDVGYIYDMKWALGHNKFLKKSRVLKCGFIIHIYIYACILRTKALRWHKNVLVEEKVNYNSLKSLIKIMKPTKQIWKSNKILGKVCDVFILYETILDLC